MFVNKARLKRKDYKIVIVTQLTYTFYNYIVVKIIGEPVYSIWTWEDYKSVRNSLIVYALSVVIFIAMTYLEQCIKSAQS